jgi:hypothetical protein
MKENDSNDLGGEQYTKYYYKDDDELIEAGIFDPYDVTPGWTWSCNNNFGATKKDFIPNDKYKRLLPKNAQDGSKVCFFMNTNGYTAAGYHIECFHKQNGTWISVEMNPGSHIKQWINESKSNSKFKNLLKESDDGSKLQQAKDRFDPEYYDDYSSWPQAQKDKLANKKISHYTEQDETRFDHNLRFVIESIDDASGDIYNLFRKPNSGFVEWVGSPEYEMIKNIKLKFNTKHYNEAFKQLQLLRIDIMNKNFPVEIIHKVTKAIDQFDDIIKNSSGYDPRVKDIRKNSKHLERPHNFKNRQG